MAIGPLNESEPNGPNSARSVDECQVWIAAARDGCSDSFGRLIERCYRYLVLCADRELGGDLRAKVGPSDLVQETLLAARANFGAFTGSTESELKAWLRAILTNRALQAGRHYRGTGKRQIQREVRFDADDSQAPEAPQLPADITPPSGRLRALERNQRLQDALDRLPADYRRAVELRSLEGLPFELVGQNLERTAEAARKLWVRGIEMLKKELRQHDLSR